MSFRLQKQVNHSSYTQPCQYLLLLISTWHAHSMYIAIKRLEGNACVFEQLHLNLHVMYIIFIKQEGLNILTKTYELTTVFLTRS